MSTDNVKKTLHVLHPFLAAAKQPLVVILGPTASGKTGFSIDLAHALHATMSTEVINADSRQLYRFLDIGTAKVTREDMRGIPHHLLDVKDPREEVTAAWYKDAATEAIRSIRARGGLPLLVGGSMLYISAIIDDLHFLPSADPELRRKLEEEYDRDKGVAMFQRLQEKDPEYAARIHPKNKHYVVRGVELLDMMEQPSKARVRGTCPFDLFIIGLEWPRMTLTRRIDTRTEAMLNGGWIDEVHALLTHGYAETDPGLVSHGYRDIIEHLRTGSPSRDELPEVIAAQTRQYAKRQMTWWKRDRRIRWMDGATGM